jgi:saccharopine dehydrogenase-like NADP-dependent oxidoreductase
MKSIIIIGAGKIGSTIFQFLNALDSLELTLADTNSDSLSATENYKSGSTLLLDKDCDFESVFKTALENNRYDAVINAGPYFLSIPIAQAALSQGLSYFDLTEDVPSCEKIQQLAQSCNDGQIFMPQCGLAPGFISILTRSLYDQFESLESVQLRVGALPQFPTNQMLYNLTWSTAGLVNEYCNRCQAIEQGQVIYQTALDGKEEFSLEGIKYEAFNTSGGLGTLTKTLAGKVEQLNYKTVRYPGHRKLMKFLLKDLKFQQPEKRSELVQLLDQCIPMTTQDVVLIMVTVTGIIKPTSQQSNDTQKNTVNNSVNKNNSFNNYQQLTELRRIHHKSIDLPDGTTKDYSAIQICTAASLSAIIELWMQGTLNQSGFIYQESISLEQFYQTHYGKYLLPSIAD